MSESVFKLAAALLSLYILTAIIYYLCRPAKFLNRMPVAVAAVVSYVVASHAINDLRHENGKARDETYAFGRFTGRDEGTYIGIEKMSHIIPEQPTGTAIRLQRFVRVVLNMGRQK